MRLKRKITETVNLEPWPMCVRFTEMSWLLEAFCDGFKGILRGKVLAVTPTVRV